jgi:hypothetical protein
MNENLVVKQMEEFTQHSIQLDVTSLASLKESLPSSLRDLADAGLSRNAQLELLHAVIRQMGGTAEMHVQLDAMPYEELGSVTAAAVPVAVAADPVAAVADPVAAAAVPVPAAADPVAAVAADPVAAAADPVAAEPAEPAPEVVAALAALVEPRETPRPTIEIHARKHGGCYCQ